MLHHSWIEISKSALLHNISQYKQLLAPQTLLAPVIKSNAYGHGILEVGSILDESPMVDYLCVVSLSEAILLRSHGITKPLLVLSFLDADLNQIALQDIDVTIYDITIAQMLNSIGQKHNTCIAVHIKIDTGLSRLGVRYEDAYDFILTCARLSHLEVRGVFSHFAASERSDLSFSYTQLARLQDVIEKLETTDKLFIPHKHCAASAALTALPESHLTFARLGISTYGLWSSAEIKVRTELMHPGFSLQPVATWKTRVIARKTIPAGSFVGYDCTYQTATATEIAVLPIGYFDGYDRKLSNQSCVKINDQLFPIRGRIAMNLCMVDVTAAHHSIEVGDEVVLLGNDHLITAETLAEQSATINYEFIARINPALKRIIVA